MQINDVAQMPQPFKRLTSVSNQKVCKSEQEKVALIALGGNISGDHGGPEQAIPAAISALVAVGVTVAAQSRLYNTPCFPAGAGPDYVNAAVSVRTTLGPQALLDLLHQIEARFGRARTQRWGMRTLDLDLVAFDDVVLPDQATQDQWRHLDPMKQREVAPDQLILPHPRLQERAFVLVPLADVAPDWRHPLLGKTVQQMCADLPPEAREEVSAIV